MKGGFSLAGVGYLRHADRDAIPQAADFLITEENVHTAIVYGIVQGEGERELVVGSVRTSKVTLDVDQFLKTALGSDFRGRHYGGGRNRAGGFEIPVGFLEGTNDPEHMRLKWDTRKRKTRKTGRLGYSTVQMQAASPRASHWAWCTRGRRPVACWTASSMAAL